MNYPFSGSALKMFALNVSFCSGRYSHAHIYDYPSVSHINYIAQTNSYVVVFLVSQNFKVINGKNS